MKRKNSATQTETISLLSRYKGLRAHQCHLRRGPHFLVTGERERPCYRQRSWSDSPFVKLECMQLIQFPYVRTYELLTGSSTLKRATTEVDCQRQQLDLFLHPVHLSTSSQFKNATRPSSPPLPSTAKPVAGRSMRNGDTKRSMALIKVCMLLTGSSCTLKRATTEVDCQRQQLDLFLDPVQHCQQNEAGAYPVHLSTERGGSIRG